MRHRARAPGVAMLMVLVSLAVLTLIASETQYNAAVELRVATNARDEMRAYYLARSGLAFSRLLLKFQKQLDALPIPNLGGILSKLATPGANLASLGAGGFAGLLGGLLGGGAPGAPPGTSGGNFAASALSIQLWRMARIDCHFVAGLSSTDAFGRPITTVKAPRAPRVSSRSTFDADNPSLAATQRNATFGQFPGCFDTTISDEEERINLEKLNAPQLSAQVGVSQLLAMLSDKKFEFLFRGEDSNHVRITPAELVGAIRDWIDDDETTSVINTTTQGDVFLKGFTDEGSSYSKYEPRYKPKNARFDSMDELNLVYGMNDRIMAAVKDKITIYADVNSSININTNDPVLLELAIRSVADTRRLDPRLADPVFIDSLIQKIKVARVISLFGMSTQDFVALLAAAGVAVNPRIAANTQTQRLVGDKSSTYRIIARGTSGAVTTTITAVVRTDSDLGTLLYWRES